MQSAMPEFERPPVSEVAISVHFSALESWRSAHAGLYWGVIQSEYPETEQHTSLPPQMEKFGDEFWQVRPQPFEFVSGEEDSRLWFLNPAKTKLIQVQRDRFVINWRKVKGDEIYPRYEKELRQRWINEWSGFKQFVQQRSLGEFDIRQCEITYVNDIPQGEGWDNLSDSLKLFCWLNLGDSGGFLPAPQTVRAVASFEMPDQCGRLHVTLNHLRRIIDQREVVQLRLTVRGKPASSSDADIVSWFDLAREWIVRGFTELTSKYAHTLWKRTR